MEEKKLWEYLDKMCDYTTKGLFILPAIMIVLFLFLLFIYHILHIDFEIFGTIFTYIYIVLITMFIYCIVFNLQAGLVGFCATRHMSERSNLIWTIIITFSSVYFTYLIILLL